MKKLLLFASLLICLVSTTRAAYADTIATFTLTGSTGQNNGFGSFTVNTTTGSVLSIDFDFTGRNQYQVKNPTTAADVMTPPGYNFTDLSVEFGGIGGYSYIDISVPVTTFVGYTGGAICSIANPCSNDSVIYQMLRTAQFQSGQLTQTAVTVTPEPSSISYLLFSLACVASLPFLRRRVLQDCA